MTNLYLLLIATAAGIAVALQGQTMGALNRSAGTAATTLVTYGSGAVIAAAYWLLRREPVSSLAAPVTWYGVIAGILGLIIVGGIGYAAPRLGLTRTLVITVAAQLGAALVIESLGMFGSDPRPFDMSKVTGVVLTIAGVWLVVR